MATTMLHEISPSIKSKLCCLLDETGAWQELAEKMGYVNTDKEDHHSTLMSQLKYHKGSPSDFIFTSWAEYYHSVTELFVLFHRMKNYPAMEIIRKLVDQKYHKYIIKPETKDTGSEKILNCPLELISNEHNPSQSELFSAPKNNSPRPESIINNTDTIPHIYFNELTEATNNWNDENLLGKGGFASVYKGVWKCTEVAIKRINRKQKDDGTKIHVQQSKNELKFLNSCRHDNVLALYGFSLQEGEHPCLVYQLMLGGTLESRLSKKSDTPPLTWNQRLVIAHGTARGLQFLHNFKDKPLIHGDIKPANILLDLSLQPKIGDFGLAREGTESLANLLQVSQVYGTRPYLPYDFISSRQLSPKVDTYSFGVVLFELATGLKAYDNKRTEAFLKMHVSDAIEKGMHNLLVDSSSPVDGYQHIFEIFIKIGAECTADSLNRRPEMKVVFGKLGSYL